MSIFSKEIFVAMAFANFVRVTKVTAGGKTENFAIVTNCMQIAKQPKKSSNHKVGNGRLWGIGFAFLFSRLRGPVFLLRRLRGIEPTFFG